MWKIVGTIESRGGDIEVLPEWTIGKPNEFQSYAEADTIRGAMQNIIEKEVAKRLAQAPGVGGAGPAIRYVVLPAIDESLIRQLRGGEIIEAPKPSLPTLSFNVPKTA